MLKNLFSPILIFLVVLTLFVANFSPGTWLTGWDNLHPEFNFLLNIKRSIFAVWQEYQGLGLLGAMGHASDLPRQLLLFILSIFLPEHWLRQAYFFLMLLLGPLGFYFLLDKIVLRDSVEGKRKLASFTGALFYLLNLATFQTFYVPFEPFTAHFAFLPWLFFAAFLFAENRNLKNLLFFLIVNVVAVPQAYVPTVFLVYYFALAVAFLILLLKKSFRFGSVARVLLFTLIINSFWLLPFIYFAANNTKIPIESKINQMATEENILRNREFGNLPDVTLLRGFWFDNTDFNREQKLVYMLEPWREHFEDPVVWRIGFFLFGVVFVGILWSIVRRNHYSLVFLFLFLLSFTLLANNTPPFSWIDSLLYKIPLVAQALRFPFTKFSILAAFSYSFFFAKGFELILASFEKFLPRLRVAPVALAGIFFATLVFVTLPSFKGNLFYQNLKLDMPNEYFEVSKFFKDQDSNTRIANFPQHTFWGWNFYRWGYGGSGFLWYGVEQPILDRAFDVWNNTGENYYWEITYALYSQNRELFEKVLEKYQINWILVDRNAITSSPKASYLDELEEMLAVSGKVREEKRFGNIAIYKVELLTPVRDFVFFASNLPNVEPSYKWENYDFAYLENGDYISGPSAHNLLPTTNFYYPFRSLFSGKNQQNLEFTVEDKGEYFLAKEEIPKAFSGYSLAIPEVSEDELVWVNPTEPGEVRYSKAEVSFNGKEVGVIVPKVEGLFSVEINPASEPSVQEAKNCNRLTIGEVENKVIEENGKKFLRLKSKNATNCSAGFWLPNLPHNLAYLVTVESRNISGRSPVFWVENLTAQKADTETYLPSGSTLTKSYFIQPPMKTDGLGYSLHFDNVSIGREETINDLEKITVNPIPFNFLAQLVLVPPSQEELKPKTYEVKAVHPNPSLYEVQKAEVPNTKGNLVLVLSQSFDAGWQAYEVNGNAPSLLAPIFGKRVGDHVLVNNWANGWVLDKPILDDNPNGKIVIFFWPQLLEFVGFVLVVGFLAIFLLKRPS